MEDITKIRLIVIGLLALLDLFFGVFIGSIFMLSICSILITTLICALITEYSDLESNKTSSMYLFSFVVLTLICLLFISIGHPILAIYVGSSAAAFIGNGFLEMEL